MTRCFILGKYVRCAGCVCVWWGGRLGRGDLSGFSREWGLGGVRGRAGENLPLLTYVRVQRSFNVAYLEGHSGVSHSSPVWGEADYLGLLRSGVNSYM